MQVLPSLRARGRQAPQEAEAGNGEGCRALAEGHWLRCGDWCGKDVRQCPCTRHLDRIRWAWTLQQRCLCCAYWVALCKMMWQRTDKSTRIIARAAAASQPSGWLLSAPGGHPCRWQLADHGPQASVLWIYQWLGLLGLLRFCSVPANSWFDHRPFGETQSPNGQPCMLGDLCTHQLQVPMLRLPEQGVPLSLRLSLDNSKCWHH